MDRFVKRKQDVLSKLDKSFKNSWDEKILKLCEKINSMEEYYTTSSCAGRVVVMIDQDKKEHGLFIKVYHDLLDFEGLKRDLIQAAASPATAPKRGLLKLKMEACALHVACCDLESAQRIVDLAWKAGWKKSGIITTGKRFIVELTSTEKLEFPIIQDGKILVGDDFLEIVVKRSNDKLKRGWEKIEKLGELLK